MSAVRQSSEKSVSAGLKGKPQLDLPAKQDARQPTSTHAMGNARSQLSGDSSAKNRATEAGPLSAVALLQQSLGNQAVQGKLQSGHDRASMDRLFQLQPIIGNQGMVRRLQTKLKVNTPGDQHEQEADRVAEQVMRMPTPGAAAAPAVSSAVSGVQRKCSCGGSASECAKYQEERELALQRSASTPAVPHHAPPIVGEVLSSPGRPLDAATRAFMEPRFGRDLSRVRVHSGTLAAQSADRVNAAAYTVGSDVVFADSGLLARHHAYHGMDFDYRQSRKEKDDSKYHKSVGRVVFRCALVAGRDRI